MKKRQNPRTKSALILTFCLLFCWTAVGNTDDDIQIRKYPSSDGLVLDTISRGQKVKIVEEFGQWRYIVVEGSPYGGGWVHFQDLEKEASRSQERDVSSKLAKSEEKKPPSPQASESADNKPSSAVGAPAKGKKAPKTSFQSKVFVEAVKIHPIKPGKTAQKSKLEKPLNKSAELKKDPSGHELKSRNNALKEDLQQGLAASEEKPRRAQSVKPTPPVPSQAPPAERKKNFHEAEAHSPMEMIKTAHADPLPKTPVPSSKMQNDPATPEAPSQSSDRPAPSTRVEDNAQGFTTKEKGLSQTPRRDLINFGFRLLSVLLSCIAIVFAYKAKKMADMSYHLVSQLQQKIEIHRRREFDEGY
ncbi:MAG: hypothetical protein K9N10_10290 [Deltaproteobacteria bacterium]|nr:hypothetical protein [Deltaproteobacteria bacterium]